MTVYLVRHAKAGERRTWDGEDWLRPLSRRGQLQAQGLIEQFAGVHLDRLLSSWYVRCMESLVPLAAERRIALEAVDALAEFGTLEDALVLVRKHAHHDVVLCSHGDIIPMLLEHYSARGLDIGDNPMCPKGCTWALKVDTTGEPVKAKYYPPPPDE
jgi:8-oxo-dGTP diphosphatase